MSEILRTSDRGSSTSGLLATGLMLGLSALLSVLAAGCSSGQGDNGPVRETLADGSERVTYHRLPDRSVSLDTLAVWDLWGDDGGYLFNDITSVAGIEDDFLLLDRGNREVVRIGVDGRVRSHFGRQGSGPGEFQFPHAVEVAWGRIWVADLMNGRFSVFGPDGSYQRDLRWGDLGWRGSWFQPLADGRLLLGAETFVGFEEFDQVVPSFYVEIRDPATGQVDTLASMPGQRQHQITVTAENGQQMVFVGPPQFSARLHWAVSGDGRLFTVTGEDYRIEERDLTGRVVRTLMATTPDLTVTAADREWFFTDEFQFGFGTGEMFRATRASLEDYPFAERRQAVLGLAVDSLDRLWVLASTDQPGHPRIDLFTLAGEYSGRVPGETLPGAFTASGAALMRSEDADGLEVYTVVRPLLPD